MIRVDTKLSALIINSHTDTEISMAIFLRNYLLTEASVTLLNKASVKSNKA